MFQFFKKKTAKKEKSMTLSDYKKAYLREETTESIEALFKELKQAKVWVPFNASLMDGSDGQEGARLKPDILRKGDDYFYPCFLTEKVIMTVFLGCNYLLRTVCLLRKGWIVFL